MSIIHLSQWKELKQFVRHESKSTVKHLAKKTSFQHNVTTEAYHNESKTKIAFTFLTNIIMYFPSTLVPSVAVQYGGST